MNLIESRYVHGPNVDELLMKVEGSQTVYYHEDRLGSTTHLTDASGTVVERYRYNPFGSPFIRNGEGWGARIESAYNNRFLYTGREWLAKIGLYDYRNRAYSPNLGRFMQPDPIGFDAGDANIYRYVGNEPITRWDPYGLMAAQPVAVLTWACTPTFGPTNTAGGEWATFACYYNCTLIKKFGKEEMPVGTVIQMIGIDRRRRPQDITIWYCNKYGWTIPAGVVTAPCPSPVFIKETINRAGRSNYVDSYGFDSWE